MYRKLLRTTGEVSSSRRCVPSLLGLGGVRGFSAIPAGEHSMPPCGSNRHLSASSTSLRALSVSISPVFDGLESTELFFCGELYGEPRMLVDGDFEVDCF